MREESWEATRLVAETTPPTKHVTSKQVIWSSVANFTASECQEAPQMILTAHVVTRNRGRVGVGSS